ncbi:MAG: heat shock protein HspQ [Sphingomonadaceae bacterium]
MPRAEPVVTRFGIGDVVRHRLLPFRGVIFDVDAEFANSEDWWNAIPEESRPRRDQPFYHLLAENGEAAYVSQQNLEYDDEQEPPRHPALHQMFDGFRDGRFHLRAHIRN